MSVLITPYNDALKYLLNGTIDLDTHPLKMALVNSTYAFAATHAVFAEVAAAELAAGGGYSSGGEALTGVVVTQAAGVATCDANDVTFTALTKTFRRGIVYANATVNGVVQPLLFSVLFDSTPADITLTGSDFKMIWNAAGILTLAVV